MLFKRRPQSDFSAEIESHIALEADRLRQEGMSAADAEHAARRKFGNVLRSEEHFYESRRFTWLEDLRKDLRYALRTLRQSPAFAATVILTLALGVGATASIFSVVDAALIRPLPFPNAQRIVLVYERWQGDLDSLSPADFLDYRHQANSFAELAGSRDEAFNISGQNRPERVLGAIVTPNFFSVMQVEAQLGRTLDPSIDKPGAAHTAVIANSLWKRRYAGSPSTIGQTILLDGVPYVIVGIMPPNFNYPNSEIWASARYQVPEHPLRPFTEPSTSRGTHYFDTIGRLKPGVTTRQAEAEIAVIVQRLKQQYKDEEEGDGPAVISLRDDLVGNTRPAIFILLSAVAVLLLVACANVANIILARGATREKEIAIRGSLGAGRSRLIRQLFVESLLLSLIGAALGLATAYFTLGPLQTLLPAGVIPAEGLHIDLRLILFATGLAVFSTVLFGLFPAIQTAKADLNNVLKEGSRTASGGTSASLSRKILVAVQIALAAVLLTGAGLLVRSFDRLLSSPEGFNPDNVLSMQVSLPLAQYRAPADRTRFTNAALENLRAVPGVSSAALISRLPLNPGGSRRGITIKGRASSAEEDMSPGYLVVSPDYFRTLRIPLLAGRFFSERDDASSPGAIIINQAMARHFWPNQDPLGQYIKTDQMQDWSQIVGVVADVAQQGLGAPARPALYVPYPQDPWPVLAFVLRTAIDPKTIATAAVAAIHQVDKDEPIYNIRTMHEVVAASVQVRRFRTVLLSFFAALALALADIGIYGVMAYTVAQRGREIGIRLALGAQPSKLRLTLTGEGVRLALYGMVGGLVASFALMRFLRGILYQVAATDTLTFAAAFLFLLIAAFLASYLPARRIMKIDPANALRAQ